MSNFDDFIDSAKQKFAIGSMVLLTIFTIINAAIVTFNQNYNGFVIVFVIVSSALVLALGIIIYLIRRQRRLQCPVTHKTVINVIRREGYYPKQDNSGQISFEVNNDETYLTWFDSSRFALIYGFKLAGDEQQIRDVVLQANQNIAMAKIYAYTDEEETGTLVIQIICDAFCNSESELQKKFGLYMRVIQGAISVFINEWNSTQNQIIKSERRDHIYYPEFRWLPTLLEEVRLGNLQPGALTDEEFLLSIIKEHLVNTDDIKEWDSFKIYRVDNINIYKLIIYKFPEPKIVPEAKYGAVLMNSKTHEIDYYTMEMTFNNRWVYGKMTPECHSNYGEFDTPDLDKFVEWIFTKDKQVVAYYDYTKENKPVA